MKNDDDLFISRERADGTCDRKLRMLEGLVRILSESWNVSVVFSPEGECKTDGQIIYLPYDRYIDTILLISLLGHECGHIYQKDAEGRVGTDFNIARVIARHKKIHNRPLLYVIFNALEDVRIEIIMENKYPGFKEMFLRLIPYIQDKKLPILEREQKIKQLLKDGKSIAEVEKQIEEDCNKEIQKLQKALKEAGFSDDYIKFEIEQLKRTQEAPISEIQKILDVVYLKLRHYDYSWYPPETIDYVLKEVITTAEKVYQCKNSDETLEVAIEVYKILTDNESKIRKSVKQKQQEEDDGTGDQSTNNDENEGKGEGSEQDKNKRKAGKKGKDQEPETDEGSTKKDEEGEECQCPETTGEEGDQEQEGSSDVIRVRFGQVLQVGSKVSHLKYPAKKGIVKSIDNKTREIVVEWE